MRGHVPGGNVGEIFCLVSKNCLGLRKTKKGVSFAVDLVFPQREVSVPPFTARQCWHCVIYELYQLLS